MTMLVPPPWSWALQVTMNVPRSAIGRSCVHFSVTCLNELQSERERSAWHRVSFDLRFSFVSLLTALW